MHRNLWKTLAAAALALGFTGRPAMAEEPDAGRRLVVRTVIGTLTKLARAEGRLTVETGDDVVSLSFDRNTNVFLEHRFGSLGDLAVGKPVRVSYGEDARANWVEIRPSDAVLAPVAPAERHSVEGPPPVLAPPERVEPAADGGR
ncbi:MAG TPA: hypothetical protein VEM76_00715 [Anaeromyxobacteraceae bacterium]|nr:hypothetical protein [Anaeromyxobacteraceae bacterium]